MSLSDSKLLAEAMQGPTATERADTATFLFPSESHLQFSEPVNQFLYAEKAFFKSEVANHAVFEIKSSLTHYLFKEANSYRYPYSFERIDFHISTSQTKTLLYGNGGLTLTDVVFKSTLTDNNSPLACTFSAPAITTANAESLTLNGVTFSYITIQDNPLLDFTFLHMGPGNENNNRNVFEHITRTQASSSTHGGAVFDLQTIWNMPNRGIVIQYADFKECTTTGTNPHGGVIYASFTQTERISGYSLTFTTSADKAPGGYVYIELPSETNVILLPSFLPLKYVDEADAVMYQYVVDKSAAKNIGTISPYPYSMTLTPPASDESESCVHTTYELKESRYISGRCDTFGGTINMIDIMAAETGNQIDFTTDAHPTTQYPAEITKQLDIVGTYNEVSGSLTPLTIVPSEVTFLRVYSIVSIINIQASITSESSSLLQAPFAKLSDEIMKPKLTLTNMVFTSGLRNDGGTQPQCYLTSSLIDAKDGILTFSKVLFSYIFIENSGKERLPLLEINTKKGGFAVSGDVTFTDVTLTQGSGSVFSLLTEGNEEAEIDIENASFINCKVLNGNGGAISANLGSQTTLTINNCRFQGCKAGTSEEVRSANDPTGYGGAMYVRANGLPTVVLKDLTVKSCSASSESGGNVLFIVVESGTEKPTASYWTKMMEGLKGMSDADFIALVSTEGSQPETVKLTEYQTKDPEDDGFPGWAIALIVIGALIIIALVVLLLVYLLVCRKRKSDSYSPPSTDETEMQE